MATLNDLALRILISAKDETGPGVKSAGQGIRAISDQLQQVETLAKRFLDIRIFASWAQEGLRLSDAYKTLQARLKLVSDTTQEYATAEAQLYAISQRTRGSLEGTVTLYTKLESAIKLLGGTQGQALKTTETLNQAIALTSQGMEQDKNAILQFSQALGSGVLRGDEFNSVMENAPGLAQALADGLSVPITKLRSMAEAGQLTADKLINALGAAAPKVAEQFSKMPITVGGAMTMVNNALLNFIGHSDAANTASSRLSALLQALANNFGTVASIAGTLATVYLVRMVQGWLQSAQAAYQAAAASREKAAADVQASLAAQALLRAESEMAAIRVKAAQAMVAEAQLQKSLAVGIDQQKLATDALTAAIGKLHAAQSKAASADAAMAASMGASAGKMTILSRSTQLLGQAFNGLFGSWVAWDIGQTIGGWLRQFEAVRIAGTYLAEALVMIKTGAEGMINGMSFSERWAQIKQIHTEFEQMRASESADAQSSAASVAQSEQDKTAAIQQSALKQQESFAKVQAATQALTVQIDADAKTQTTIIQQALADRLAAIDASNANDVAKDNQRIQAKLQAAQAETTLQQQTAQLKLQLVDDEFKAELQLAANNADRMKEVETSKRQAKLSVYQGVAEFYASEVAKLSEIYAQENTAAAQSKQSLESLAADHQRNLLEIERSGMTDSQKIQSEELEYTKTVQQLKTELAKGEGANQETINRLKTNALALNKDISAAELKSADDSGRKTIALYDATKRENELYGLQKTELEANAKAHEDNASRVKKSLDEAQEKLTTANNSIKEITEQLGKDYFLKIGLDQSSLDQSQAAIAELIKPETKFIYTKTVPEGGGDQTAVPGQASGGLAGFPTGQPWRFAGGGWARLQGLLAGYGGGDRRRALLEDGEFVIRKEAVQKLGVPFMQLINAGQAPAEIGVPKLASGGSIDDEIEKKYREKGIEAMKTMLKQNKSATLSTFFAGDMSGSKAQGDVWRRAEGIGEFWKLPNSVMQQVKDAIDQLPKTREMGKGTWQGDEEIRAMGEREDIAYSVAIDHIKDTETEKKPAAAPIAPTISVAKILKLPEVSKPLTMPSLNKPIAMPKMDKQPLTIPDLPVQVREAAKGTASSQLIHGSKGGGSLDKKVVVEFKPVGGGSPIPGQFNAGDVDKLLATLKDAAGRGMVGTN